METIKVQWHSLKGTWLVHHREGDTQSFEDWAENLADLTSVRMILAAPNYATHWLNLVGVSQRHVAKVLPFALEESLIEDISHYLILPAGQANKRFRAYVVANELIEQLLELCALHHVRLQELVPESSLLGQGAQCVRQEGGWLFSWPGIFEGYVADYALTPVLDALFEEPITVPQLQLKASSYDAIQLFKTVLESTYPEQIEEISSEVISTDQPVNIPSKALNLLSGRFRQQMPKQHKPAAWWKPLAALAASWVLLWTVSLYSETYKLKNQAQEVRAQSLALYQQLFPGERIRMLERQFQEKLAGGNSHVQSSGFLNNTFKLAQVYAAQKSDKIELLSMRYNERMGETTVEIKASTLNELQSLRQALEDAGVTAEIASATNDQDGVKGRLRITG